MKARMSAQGEGARVPGEAEANRHPAPNGLHASPRVVAQRARIDAAFGPVAQRQPGLEDEEPLQAKKAEAAGGLPGGLRAGIEALSGVDMSGVRVHHNSDQPAQLHALAYAQGSDIHLAAGQEQHLPHEAWHVVQQAQGRAPPTLQLQGGVAVNDDADLESEADAMGARALAGVAQRVVAGTRQDMAPALQTTLQMKGGRALMNCDPTKKFSLNKGDCIAYDQADSGFKMTITIRSRNGVALVPAVTVAGIDAVNLKKVLEDIDEPAIVDNTPSEKVGKLSEEARLEEARLKTAVVGGANRDLHGGVQNSFFTKPKAVGFNRKTGDIEVEMLLCTYNMWDRVGWRCRVGPFGGGIVLQEDQRWWSNPAWNAAQMYPGYAFRSGCDVSTLTAQGQGKGGVRRLIRTTVPGLIVKKVFGSDLSRLKKSSVICFGMEVFYTNSGPATASKQEFESVYADSSVTAHWYGFGAMSTPESYGYVDLAGIDIAEGDWLSDEEVWDLDIGPNPSPNIKLAMPEHYARADLIKGLQPTEGMQMATRIENEATLGVSSLARLKTIIAQMQVLAKSPGLVNEIMQGDPTLSQFEWTVHADTNSDVFTDVYLDDLRHTALRAGIGIRKRWTDKATKLNVKTGPGYQVGALDKDDRESDTVKSDIYRRHEIGYDLDPKASIENIVKFLAAGPGSNDPWNRGGGEIAQALPEGGKLDFSQLRGTMVLKGDRQKFNLKAVHKKTGGAINIEISCDHTVGRTFEDYERVQSVSDLFTANGKYAQVFNVEMELEHLGAGGKSATDGTHSSPSTTASAQDTGNVQEPSDLSIEQPRRPRPDHPGRIYMRNDTANPNFNTPSFQVFAKAHQRMIQFLQFQLHDSTELGEDRQKLETLFAQLFSHEESAYGPPVVRGDRVSPSPRDRPTSQASASVRSPATRVADKVPGGRLVNVDGTGLNCSIRALMLASGRAIDEKMVTQLREQLVNGAKATEGSFLGLGLGEKESRHLFELMASYLQGRPVVVLYDHQATLDEHQVWPGDGKPIVVYLSGYHYQAVVPG